MRLLPLALFLAVGTWIAGCASPDVVGTRTHGGDVAGDDDDDPTPAKKKKTTPKGSPVGATETTPGSNTTPTSGDPTVTPPSSNTTPTTDTTTPTTPAPTTTPTPTPAPDPTPAPTTPAPVVHTTFTTTANLNLREGPSTADTIILTMPKGSQVEAIDETPTSNWYHVTYQGQDGWASGSYLEEN